jgi:asparagine synthase (glutamine-hydrolysing)
MCGICGLFTDQFKEQEWNDLLTMHRLAAHRGPDDDGIVLFGEKSHAFNRQELAGSRMPDDDRLAGGLGHNRLSIIDLSPSGHQPMCDLSGRYWIVFNGELYNYLEIRAELQQKGYRFRSDSDTEVALSAFMAWGRDALRRFNGMWALAIYDQARQTLFLSRDRFGIKPLYYTMERNRFAFASEIKQLLSLSHFSRAINKNMLADFLFWNFQTHTEQTFVENIHSLPPSGYLELNCRALAGAQATPGLYWQVEPEDPLPEKQAVQRFYELLADSVRLRLRSDVPVGIKLSGGLDSSSLTCLAAPSANQTGPLQTFTVVFEDERFSEKSFAEEVIRQTDVQPTFLTLAGNQLAEDWHDFVWSMEEPFSSLSYYSNWKIYQLIKRFKVPVILNGQGGDELLLGYDRYRAYNTFFLLQERAFGQMAREINLSRSFANLSVARQMAYVLYFLSPQFRAMKRKWSASRYLSAGLQRVCRERRRATMSQTVARTRQQLQINDYFKYQLPHLLRHEDRVSMFFAIESRIPFMDYRLFNFIIGQKTGLLIRDGYSKYILRESMKGVLPESIRLRVDKVGFSTPGSRMVQENKIFFSELLRRHTDDPYLDMPTVVKLFNLNQIEEKTLISILSYLSWKEKFKISV